ncbi:MAG: hypothetical protein RR198_03895 [Oscillospiraceae bacterium]
MPNVLTHLHFCFMTDNINPYFVLGAIAPDSSFSQGEEAVKKLHFKGTKDDRCNIEKFLQRYENENLNDEEAEFLNGYLSHLWLDNFALENEMLTVPQPQLSEKAVKIAFKENLKTFFTKETTKLLRGAYRADLSGFSKNIFPLADRAQHFVEDITTQTCCPNVAENLIVIKIQDYKDFLHRAKAEFEEQVVE